MLIAAIATVTVIAAVVADTVKLAFLLYTWQLVLTLFKPLTATFAIYPVCFPQVFRRALASVITLGSGASLGPEAPSVELGANTAAVFAPKHLSKRRQRMLVAAGAAAGKSLKIHCTAWYSVNE